MPSVLSEPARKWVSQPLPFIPKRIRDALHVSFADESICIGPAPARESYLNMQAILSAAVLTGAEAIHPGYGLLSENARFARLCAECGLVFIGPPAEVIERMGDKDEARRTMREAGVPVVPGSDIVSIEEEALAAARTIGFPLLVKARSGGGGRGIRLVEHEDALLPAFLAATSEAAVRLATARCIWKNISHRSNILKCSFYAIISAVLCVWVSVNAPCSEKPEAD